MTINYAAQIKDLVSMHEVARMYGFIPNRAGFIVCPFHAEKTPSFKIYDGTGGYSCYGCGRSGSVIDFVMEHFGLSFIDACKRINNDFLLGLPLNGELSLRQKRSIRDEWRARKALQSQENERRDRVSNKYHEALDLYCACDLIMIHAAPMSNDWSSAAKHIDYAKYLLEEAEMEVYMEDARRGKQLSNT